MSAVLKSLILLQDRGHVVQEPPALALDSAVSLFDAMSCQECDDAWTGLSRITEGQTGLGYLTFMNPKSPKFLQTNRVIRGLHNTLPHVRLQVNERVDFIESIVAGSDASIMKVSWNGATRVAKLSDDCKERMGLLLRGLGRSTIDARMSEMLNREYIMLKAAGGIGPRVYGISQASELVKSATELPLMVQNKYYRKHFRQCKAVGAKMQMIIMDEVGPAIHDFSKSRSSDYLKSIQFTIDILHIFKKVLRLLETLHRRGIVHGDIHAGNIAFKSSDVTRESELVLLDFENSIFVGDIIGSDQFGNAPVNLNPKLLSPWHLQNQRLGPRDDVYRLLGMAANLLSRWAYVRGLKRLINERIETEKTEPGDATYAVSRDVCLLVKLKCSMFRRSDYLGSQMYIGSDPTGRFTAHQAVVDRLEDLHLFIRDRYTHPDAAIEYEYIHSEIDAVLQMIDF